MGLSNFPSASEGVLPVLVLNTVLSVALLKNMLRSFLQVMGTTWSSNFAASSSNVDIEDEADDDTSWRNGAAARERRRISISRFKCTRHHSSAGSTAECCVCLCGFEGDEEVSELLSCKHFFHRGCLDKWFNNHHTTCPLCRSIQ